MPTNQATSSSINNASYEIPPFMDANGNIIQNEGKLLEHLNHVVESSKAFLRSNRGFKTAEICRQIISGDDKNFNGLQGSGIVEINKLRRQGREIVGNVTNMKPNFSIRTPKIKDAQEKAATYEELKDHWWYAENIDRIFKEAVHEAGSGIGYLFVVPKKNFNTGKVEICCYAKSYKEVLPYQMGMDNDLDKAYSVTIWCEMPLAEFKESFPAFRSRVKPTRNAPTYIGKRFNQARANFRGGIRGHLRRGLDKSTDSVLDPSFPMVDVFYTYTRDDTINDTGKSLKLGTLVNGDLAGHDSYEVPSYDGSQSPDDCKLFPRRRLTIWVPDQFVVQDGPPKWINEHVPVAEFRFERLPKEFIGVPILNDGRSLENAINRMINSILERARALAEFPIGYDENLPKQIKELLRKKGLRGLIGKGIPMNPRMAAKPIAALFEKNLFEIYAHEFEIIKSLMELQDYVTGTNDYSNLQRKNQIPAADTQEALVQNLGAVPIEHDREISIGIQRFGRIVLNYMPQVYTAKKRVTILGSNGLSLKDLDYDPSSLVPSLDPVADKPYWKRLSEHLERFNLIALPGSMQERQSTTTKLTLLQLLKSGGRISDEALYEAFVGDERFAKIVTQWEGEQLSKAKLAAMIRMEVEAITQSAGSPEGGNLVAQLAQMLSQQNTLGEGRPSTNRTMPRAEVKTDEDGVLRSTSATN